MESVEPPPHRQGPSSLLTFLLVLCACVVWWTLAFTVCFPVTVALLLSQRFRSSFFPFLYHTVMETYINEGIVEARVKAFAFFRGHVALKDKSVPLEVLEIGIGYGANLEYYPENVNLTVLDKNPGFESRFLQNAKRFPHISYQRTVIQPAEDMSEIEDNSFDVVVSTYLHCSTQDSRAILREVKRVLKPGGLYYFLDHVSFPRRSLGFYLQLFIDPVWYLYFNGCSLQRNVAPLAKETGFSKVTCHHLQCTMPRMYLLKHQTLVVATK